jgi:hypothetical protein
MSDTVEKPIPFAAWIGLDWADRTPVINLRPADSQRLETYELEQTPEALRDWLQQLRQRFGGRPIAMALEQSRGPLLFALMPIEFLVLYPINPKSLASYRESLSQPVQG